MLVAIFAERESHAAYFPQEQDMTRYDAVNYISYGIAKRPGLSESRPPAVPRRNSNERLTGDDSGERPKKKGDALDAYCINLNKKARRQDRPAHRPRGRGSAHDPGPLPPPEEQPSPGRRSRRRQDRHRRGPRPQDRPGGSARGPGERHRLLLDMGTPSPAPATAAISRNV